MFSKKWIWFECTYVVLPLCPSQMDSTVTILYSSFVLLSRSLFVIFSFSFLVDILFLCVRLLYKNFDLHIHEVVHCFVFLHLVQQNGFTPLHIACKKNRIRVIELLLQYGAMVGSTTESGLTPLHVSSFMGYTDIVQFLLHKGSDPNAQTGKGETSLHLATRGNQIDTMKLLLENGAKVDAEAKVRLLNQGSNRILMDLSWICWDLLRSFQTRT